jgi:hypothetical protein
MHQQGGKPFSFLINFDSVMTRCASVRCGKWRPGVSALGRCALMMRLIWDSRQFAICEHKKDPAMLGHS